MTDALMADFPKLECPFVRVTQQIGSADFRKYRAQYHLRQPELYLVTDKINPGYEWVFDDPATFAVEKLNGTNIKIRMAGGRLVMVQNRKNIIDPLALLAHNSYIMDGIYQAAGKGYVPPDGEVAGELIGPKLQGNPYGLAQHLWYPFPAAETALAYRSFHEHARTFANWSAWFKDGLQSRFCAKRAAKEKTTASVLAEGVVFYHAARREQGLVYMAKLRRDMFDWYYAGITGSV